MNILPSIDKNRKGFKFSNPLSGVIYNNNNYLKQCQYEPDPENIIMHRRKTSHQTMQSFIQQNQRRRKKQKSVSYRECFYNKINNQRMGFSAINTSYSKGEAQVPKIEKGEKNVYRFPDIEIKIIDEITFYKDFMQKNLRVNLAHYFGIFFKKSLAGSMTDDVIEVVQKYLQILVDKRKLDTPVETKDYPSQFFTLKSKRAFMQRIQELENKKNFKPIQQMIKFYCVPAKQFRQSCFRDIIHMLRQSLYQKFNLSKQKDYALLDENGKLIEEICAIKFSTTQLLITNRVNYQRSYNQYRNIIQSNLQNFKKISFSQGLKKSFRGIIAAGKFDQSPTYNDKDMIQARNKRIFAESKLQKHRKSDKSLEKIDLAKTTNNFNSKSKQKNTSHRKSKSSLSKAQTIQQISQIKIRSVSARKRDELYQAAFERLVNLNSFYDITFNHLNDKKILMAVFKKQFEMFKNKSVEQIDEILKAFKINPQTLSITWDQFRMINEVANCKGQNEDIVDFVSRYLPFNQFGQMNKEDLSKTLKFILNQVDGEQIVLEIIWSWLYKNNLIQSDGVLVRTTLESWYQKNKMAFAIMVSLIFGTNQMSWIDMAYQVLV